jgi:hypothetical protein
MSSGFDYGRGVTNIDPQTGIRYGVISMHSVLQAWADSSEPIYPCSECGYWPDDSNEDENECEYCSAYGYKYEGEGYTIISCLDTDIMVIKSPFYTYARFCSPCVPGAGNLDEPDPDRQVKTYALGHDWFEAGKAPYPVFKVQDDQEVSPML